VHAKGSFIFLQLWANGHPADPSFLGKQDPPLPYISASDVKLSTYNVSPRPLTIPEIHSYIEAFRTAAGNAVSKAGFDGVEIHGANGYLIEQFLKDITNKRTDEYGGSISGRSKFVLEVVDAVVEAVGERKTAIRLSPWNTSNGLLHLLLVIFRCTNDAFREFRRNELGRSSSNLLFCHRRAKKASPRPRLHSRRRAAR
jgi:NADPH2 dehydrogenase